MHGYRLGLIIAAIFLGVFAASYWFLSVNGERELSATLNEGASPRVTREAASPAGPAAPASEPVAQNAPPLEPPADMPTAPAGGAMPPAASADPPGSGVPLAPSSTAMGDTLPPGYASGGNGGGGSGGVALPPAAANGHAAPPAKNGHSGNKVLSYFQRTRTQVDTSRAFGFVLMPKVAVTDEEKRTQKDFCTLVLASMDFMTPGAIAEAPVAVLATYWPIVASRESFEIKAAFAERNCDDLIAWYDHKLARGLAAKAGIAGLGGPLLITWPSAGASEEDRNPLIVDFSRADQAHATKALQYWFRQLKNRPELWTNRIREGTIRAELADAVNDTAGVVLAVLHGKWDSLNAVSATP